MEEQKFLGFKQVKLATYEALSDAEKKGYLWLVRELVSGETKTAEIYYGTRKYAELNQNTEDVNELLAYVENLKESLGEFIAEDGTYVGFTPDHEILGNEDINTVEDALAALETAIIENSGIKELEERVEAVESGLTNLETVVEENTTKIETLENTVNEAISDINDNFEKVEGEIETINNEIETINDEISGMTSTLEQHGLDIEELQKKVAEIADIKVIRLKGMRDSFDQLPQDGNKEGDLWLVATSDSGAVETNVFTEYVWIEKEGVGHWEKFGEVQGITPEDLRTLIADEARERQEEDARLEGLIGDNADAIEEIRDTISGITNTIQVIETRVETNEDAIEDLTSRVEELEQFKHIVTGDDVEEVGA